MKQILIEKYIKPSEVEFINNGSFTERWFNDHEEFHSFMGHPAAIWYDKYGEIETQYWFKKNLYHREKRLPSIIYYENEKTKIQSWYKNGIFIKEERY
jgi:hypothetical protein